MPARLFNEILAHTLQHSFVQVESNETKLYIDPSGSSKCTGQLHPISLRIHRERNEKDMVLNGADRVVVGKQEGFCKKGCHNYAASAKGV